MDRWPVRLAILGTLIASLRATDDFRRISYEGKNRIIALFFKIIVQYAIRRRLYTWLFARTTRTSSKLMLPPEILSYHRRLAQEKSRMFLKARYRRTTFSHALSRKEECTRGDTTLAARTLLHNIKLILLVDCECLRKLTLFCKRLMERNVSRNLLHPLNT